MTKDISFAFLFKILKKAWWKILIFALIVAIATAAFTNFFIPKKYSSSVQFFVINTSTSVEYTTSALLMAAEYLSSDYIEIINGDETVNAVLSDVKNNPDIAEDVKNMTAANLRSIMSSSVASATSTFRIIVTHTNKEVAYCIAESIMKHAPEIIKTTAKPSYATNLYKGVGRDENGNPESYEKLTEDDLECVTVLRAPERSRIHISPSMTTNSIIAAVVAAAIAYAFCLIRQLLDTVVRNEDNIKELIDEPIIGDIPKWDIKTSNKEKEVENEQKQ